MTDLSSLIERLGKLDGPSHPINAELYATIGGAPHTSKAGNRVVPYIQHGDPDEWPDYTGSIDAIVALIGKLGFQWLKKSPESMTVYSPLTAKDDAAKKWAVHHSAAGATPAIALCIALLQAIKEREGKP